MEGEDKYYDNHTMYLFTSGATEKQLNESFREAMCTLEKTSGKRYQCRYQVNIVRDKLGKTLGFGYLWVSNPEIYHMLIGNNPDGSVRRERIIREDSSVDDGNDDIEPITVTHQVQSGASDEGMKVVTRLLSKSSFNRLSIDSVRSEDSYVSDEDISEVQPVTTVDNNQKSDNSLGVTNQLPFKRIDSWADSVEEEEAEALRNSLDSESETDEQLWVELPRLMTLPKFKYTDAQLKEYDDGTEFGTFTIHQAYVNKVEDNRVPNKLISRDVPQWVSTQMMKSIFAQFASDANKVVQVRAPKSPAMGRGQSPVQSRSQGQSNTYISPDDGFTVANKGMKDKRSKKEKGKVADKWIDDNYPLIEIKDQRIEGRWVRNLLVTFDPLTRDAQFALCMNKKYALTNPSNGKVTYIHFSHASYND